MRLRIATIMSAIVVSSVSAFGQSGQSLALSLQAAAQNAARQPQAESVRRLSIDEAVKLALEQNLGIRIQRIDPQISDIGIAQAKAFWAPNLTTNFSKNSQTQQSTSSLAGGATNILNNRFDSQVGVNQQLPWGGA